MTDSTRPVKRVHYLKSGERIPAGEPRRYIQFRTGYVILRWLVANRSYVEVLEHRVVGDRVTDAEHVHHIDRDRTNNDPSNLLFLTADEHLAIHGADIDRDEAVRLYISGWTVRDVARHLGANETTINWTLRQCGIKIRPAIRGLDRSLDRDRMVELYGRGMSLRQIGREVGCGHHTVTRELKIRGVR